LAAQGAPPASGSARARNNDTRHLGRARFDENACTGLERGPGGHYIVHQGDAGPSKPCGRPRVERTRHVDEAVGPRELRLGRRLEVTRERKRAVRRTDPARQSGTEQCRLVVAATGQPSYVERNRNDDVDGAHRARSGAKEQVAQRARKVGAIFVFHPSNRGGERAAERSKGNDAVAPSARLHRARARCAEDPRAVANGCIARRARRRTQKIADPTEHHAFRSASGDAGFALRNRRASHGDQRA